MTTLSLPPLLTTRSALLMLWMEYSVIVARSNSERTAGTVAGFNYSSANKNSGLVWTRETLDAYLADPQTMVPGTLMVFPGIKNGGDRQALVEFLASQHD